MKHQLCKFSLSNFKLKLVYHVSKRGFVNRNWEFTKFTFNIQYMSRCVLEPPVLPADLFVPSPGYEVPSDLATVPPPLVCAVYVCGARNVGSNVRTDIAGIVT